LSNQSRTGSAPEEREAIAVAANGRAPWRETLAPYAKASPMRSAGDILTSAVPYIAMSIVVYFVMKTSLALALLLEIPTAGFLLRTYIVFHDCAHGSFLPSRKANVWVGVFFGLLVLTPFVRWRHDHSVHHATAGDLDRRGVGDLPTLTVSEYQEKSWRGRLGYRLFRSPPVMFGIGPVFAMIVGPRLVAKGARPRMRRSVLGTDIVLALVVAGLCLSIGWGTFLFIWLPPAMLAGATGIWLFYVQHQFEDTYWQRSDGWTYADAALRGSSYLKLPKILQFFTGNIGLHHVHHLSARIPNYNLQRAHDENPIFHEVPTLSLWNGLSATRLKLWDEASGRLVTFAQARAVRA
jgi:omega-6 fatty acid desaturase (delta-12 desaturase)